MASRQFSDQERAGNAAKPANAQHPSDASSAALRGVVTGGQRRHGRLGGVHDSARHEHHQHQNAHIASHLADGINRHGGQRIAHGDDLVAIETVHQPAKENRAHTAQREQRGNQRCIFRRNAGVLEQNRHPVDQRIENHQPHKVSQPQHE